MGYEQPRYVVERRYEDFEIRKYEPYIVAETEVEGVRQSAGTEGFRRLAGYIFGKNRRSEKLAMTAPVTQTKGIRIAMTAPVAEMASEKRDDRFLVQFMMPSQFRIETLPKPLDERIHFRKIPPRRMAAIRYSGSWSEKRYLSHLDRLRTAMRQKGIEEKGDPIWARYDPPFKPWFLRRNEILIEIG
ncbi:SOUL heme-binding protein [Chitinispirillum alkaliphilum]|nr:SOUL heme-binding protein [Chitinispirillum alkaliphilum]